VSWLEKISQADYTSRLLKLMGIRGSPVLEGLQLSSDIVPVIILDTLVAQSAAQTQQVANVSGNLTNVNDQLVITVPGTENWSLEGVGIFAGAGPAVSVDLAYVVAGGFTFGLGFGLEGGTSTVAQSGRFFPIPNPVLLRGGDTVAVIRAIGGASLKATQITAFYRKVAG
jgi:hypothetical protein